MTINITSQMSPEEILQVAHKATAVPSVIIVYLAFTLLSLVIGLSFGGKGKFMWSWVVTVIAVGLIVVWVSVSPETVQLIVEKISSFLT